MRQTMPEEQQTEDQTPPNSRGDLLRLIGVASLVVVLLFALAEIGMRIVSEPDPLNQRLAEEVSLYDGRYSYAQSALVYRAGEYHFNAASREGQRHKGDQIEIALIGDNTFACVEAGDATINPIAMQVAEELEGNQRFRVLSFSAPRLSLENAHEVLTSKALPASIDAVVIGVGIEYLASEVKRSTPPPSRFGPSFSRLIDLAKFDDLDALGPAEAAVTEEGMSNLLDVERLFTQTKKIRAAAQARGVGVMLVLLPSHLHRDDLSEDELAHLGTKPSQLKELGETLARVWPSIGHLPAYKKAGVSSLSLAGLTQQWRGDELRLHPLLGTLLSDEARIELGRAIGKGLKERAPWVHSQSLVAQE